MKFKVPRVEEVSYSFFITPACTYLVSASDGEESENINFY